MGIADVVKKVAQTFMDTSAPGAITNVAQTGARLMQNNLGDLPMGGASNPMGNSMPGIGSSNQFGGLMSAGGRNLFGNAMGGLGRNDPFGQSMSFGSRDPFGGGRGGGNPWAMEDRRFSGKMEADRIKQQIENNSFLNRDQSGAIGQVGGSSGVSGDPTKANTAKISGTNKWDGMIMRAAEEQGIPASVLKALMAIESGGVQPSGANYAGAVGLMQILPKYWQGTANKYGGDLNDPYTNIRTAADIMHQLYQQHGTWERAATAYFTGSPNLTGARDAYSTDYQYVEMFRNNVAAIEAAAQVGSGSIGNATGFGNAHAPNAINIAKTALGKPYVWGGAELSAGGFDCSGLIVWAYNQAGKPMARETSQTMYAKFQPISGSDLKAGDLVFYHFPGANSQSGANHVAMYIGNGQLIQATSNGSAVQISPSDWAQGNIIGYRRVP